jgi:hypothetical protein
VLAGTTEDGREAEMRVEGVGLMREATLIVITPLEPDPATLRELGDMNQTFAAAWDDVGEAAAYMHAVVMADEGDLGYAWWEPLHPQAINVTVIVSYGWQPDSWADAITVPVIR